MVPHCVASFSVRERENLEDAKMKFVSRAQGWSLARK